MSTSCASCASLVSHAARSSSSSSSNSTRNASASTTFGFSRRGSSSTSSSSQRSTASLCIGGWRSKHVRVAVDENRRRICVRAQGDVERSYVMVKPDGVQRGLVGEIISRFERKGFKLEGLKLFQCTKELAEKHYEELREKPFFPKLVSYIISGPVVCMIWEGPGVVASARKLIGSTNPLSAEPGTIRGDLGIEVGRNVVHGSDSVANGEREIGLWFTESEVCEWDQELTPWLRE